jgi:hypothetical protein
MKKHVAAALAALVIGIAGGFIVADSRAPEPVKHEDGQSLSSRVTRLEERIEALQSVHDLIGRR